MRASAHAGQGGWKQGGCAKDRGHMMCQLSKAVLSESAGNSVHETLIDDSAAAVHQQVA